MCVFRSFWWCILVYLSEQKTPGVVQSGRETQPLHKPGDFSILKNKNPFQVSHVPGVERKCKQELYIVSISEWKVRDGVWGRHNFTGVSLVYNPEIPRSQTKGKALRPTHRSFTEALSLASSISGDLNIPKTWKNSQFIWTLSQRSEQVGFLRFVQS